MPRAALATVATAALALACADPSSRVTGPTRTPLPAELGPGVRVHSGTTAALTDGPACTHEAGADGERWCGFVAWTDEGLRNLFVFNLSQVLAGVPVSCDAPEPNCLLLTQDLKGSAGDYHGTFFWGDSLVYYDETLTPYVWRPGMDAGRLLALHPDTTNVSFCSPASQGMAASCLGFPYVQPDPLLAVGELYAGTIDGEAEPLLSPIDTVIAATQADVNGVLRFNVGFPASGYIGWSAREEVDGPEVLKLQLVDDPESKLTVASDVHDWSISRDGTSWLWSSAADEQGVGTLQTAAFPDGSYPSDVLGGIAGYLLDAEGTVVALTDAGEIIAIADAVGAPEEQVLVDSGVREVLGVSDHGAVAYSKVQNGAKLADLYVSKLDGTRTCVLDASGMVPKNSVHFSPDGKGVLWPLEHADGYDAYHSELGDCSTEKVAEGVVMLGWMGGGNAIFMDEFDAENGYGTLKSRRVGRNGELEAGEAKLIAERADDSVSFGEALTYTVNAGTDGDGLYVRAF